jgi:hypothetical protein
MQLHHLSMSHHLSPLQPLQTLLTLCESMVTGTFLFLSTLPRPFFCPITTHPFFLLKSPYFYLPWAHICRGSLVGISLNELSTITGRSNDSLRYTK